MLIDEKMIKLKNEQVCILRNPKPHDVVQLVEYLKATAAETDFLLKYPEEVRITAEQEKEYIESLNGSKRDLMIIAEIDGEVAGNCSFLPVGEKTRVRHRCSIGIALYKKYCLIRLGLLKACIIVGFNRVLKKQRDLCFGHA